MAHSVVRALVALVTLAVTAASAASQTTVIRTSDGNVSTITITQGGDAVIGGVTGGVVAGPTGPPTQGTGALPPRDGRVPVTGTGRVSGVVTAAESGRPIRRATVRLAGGGPALGMTTGSTDAEGRYEFTNVAAGRYTVIASRTGFVQTSYGQKRPNTQGLPVIVQEGAATVRVDIALPSAGVISGRVVDEYGEPVADAIVSAMRRQFISGERRLVTAGSTATTNDIGEFRLHSLAPGDYFVSTTLRNMLTGTTDRVGYAPTFYPSAGSADTAQALTVHAAETVSNAVVTLLPSRLSRVSGYVVGEDGRPVQVGSVMAMPRSGIQFANASGMVRPDGSFEVGGLADGDYTLRTMIGPIVFGAGAPPQGPPLQATAIVTVAGGDVSNVVLRPVRPVVISGRVTGDAATMAAIQPGTMQVLAARLSPMDVVGPSGPPARLREDFTFELTVYPGRVSLRGTGLNGTLIESVRWNGIDVTRGFDLADAVDGGGFELTMTNRTAKVAVTVADARGQAIPGCDVVIFTADEEWWGASMPGHNSAGRTSQEGRYEAPPLLPGTYYVIAIDGLESFQAGDPAFIASLRDRAQRISVAAGETANVQARIQEP
jgi:hypothetical protein